MEVNKNISLLDKRVKKTVAEQSSNKETMLMLSAPERKEEIEILKKIGLSTHIQEVEATLNDVNRLRIVSEKFGRKTYYGHQIKELCDEYDLKFLRADSFKGKLPTEVGQSILDFIKENTFTQEKNENRTIEKTDLDIVESSFFVLSTRKSFAGTEMKSATLFYRENKGDYRQAESRDVFIEIHSWGKPYSNNVNGCLADIFNDGDEVNFNIFVFIVLAVSFICGLFFNTSLPYWYSFLYVVSVFILSISTYKSKKSKWNQVEN